jgi:peptide/nickel transport system ATP-binding protein
MIALAIERLEVRYAQGRSSLVAVAGVDLAVEEGRTHGLVGESGSGKSTIARAVVGLVPLHAGTIRFAGKCGAPTAAKRHGQAQIVFQNPYASLNPRMRVREAIAEVLQIHHPEFSGSERRSEAQRILTQVGLAEDSLERFPHQFSGGQRQRVAIARALATNAPVIILDEITSALDVSVQATILNLLREIQRERRVTFLFISHDLAVVRYVSDIVSVMHLGRIVETAPTERLFESPLHPYTRALLDALPMLGPERPKRLRLAGELPDPRRPPTGCRFHTRCPIGPSSHPGRVMCREMDPPMRTIATSHLVACHFAEA